MRRVVVTGLGAITPIGNNVKDFFENVKAEKTGFSEITQFDASEYKCRLAAEVKDFDPAFYMDKKSARRMRNSSFMRLPMGVISARSPLREPSFSMTAPT